ncbi:MAG TPA: hypothetical protein VGS41_04840 [Chthonomonadales bacterium]|nr:hypothetical protein [Chthonomonadales bacterium]
MRSRYSRVFGMSGTAVAEAFTHLRCTRLPADRVMQMHFVRPGEQITYKLKKMRRGTKVFALGDRPVLAQICGNPVLGEIVTRPHDEVTSDQVQSNDASQEPAGSEAVPPSTLQHVLLPAEPSTELDSAQVALATETPLPGAIAPENVTESPVEQLHTWTFSPLALAPLAAVPLLFERGSGSHSSSGVNLGPIPGTGHLPGPPGGGNPVPEMGTYASFGTFLAAGAILLRLRRPAAKRRV